MLHVTTVTRCPKSDMTNACLMCHNRLVDVANCTKVACAFAYNGTRRAGGEEASK